MSLESRFLIAQLRCWMLIIPAFVLIACAGPETQIDRQELSGVETILVLPFYHIEDNNAAPVIIDCKLCRQRHVFEAVATDDAQFMSTKLMALLRDEGTYQYVLHEQAGLASADINYVGLARGDFSRILAPNAIGQKIDAVLMGFIYRFRERVGKSYGIESPASVAFSLVLVNADDGQVAWHSHYKETQEALFSNLLTLGKFIKRKARWVTARELATESLEDMLSTLKKP